MPAYLSSASATENLLHSLLPENLKNERILDYEKGCEDWKKMLATDVLPIIPSFQIEWERPLLSRRFEALLNEASSNA